MLYKLDEWIVDVKMTGENRSYVVTCIMGDREHWTGEILSSVMLEMPGCI